MSDGTPTGSRKSGVSSIFLTSAKKALEWLKYKQTEVPEAEVPSWEKGFNPLSLGVLLFVFSLILWQRSEDNSLLNAIGAVAFFMSVLLGVAIVLPLVERIRPRTRIFERIKLVYFVIFSFAILAFFFNFTIQWLDTLSSLSNAGQLIVSAAGLFWFFIFIIVETDLACKYIGRWLGLIFSLVIFYFVYNSSNDWISFSVLAAFGLGVLFKSIFSRWRLQYGRPF